MNDFEKMLKFLAIARAFLSFVIGVLMTMGLIKIIEIIGVLFGM